MNYPEVTVGAVIFNKKNEILLCKSSKWGNKYIIPGGHIELGEKMEDALKREMKEETGLDIYNINLLSIKESIYDKEVSTKKHFIFIDYTCKTDSTDVILNHEAESYVWTKLDKIHNYDLGGFVKELLIELKNKSNSKYKSEVFYGY